MPILLDTYCLQDSVQYLIGIDIDPQLDVGGDKECQGCYGTLFTQTKNLLFLELLHHLPHTHNPVAKMDKRTGESPMEFEWETKAPGDASSPFFQLGAQHHDKKRWCPDLQHLDTMSIANIY